MAQKDPLGTKMVSTTDDEFWRRSVERHLREHFAEESERSRLDIEPSPNEYQMAEEHGERHGAGQVSGYIADAGDLAGG